MSGPRIEIDVAAVAANWRMLAERAGPATCAAVVKADCYGLGADRIAPALHRAGARLFYVAWPAEGVRLRRALSHGGASGPIPEIRVFHGFAPGPIDPFRDHALTPVLNSLEDIAAWRAHAGTHSPFAIHLDTGMSRLGLPVEDWTAARDLTADAQPAAILSHLACGDEPNHAANARQLERFRAGAALWPGRPASLSATAGIYLGRDFLFDEVRPGIGLYGGGPAPSDGRPPVPVVRMLAPVLQIRLAPAGASVGYGGTWTAPRETRLATLGAGYADGVLRAASNRADVAIAGVRRPILGRISMDLIVIDATDIDIAPGDMAEIFGPALPLGEQASHMATIDYELLTRLSSRAERIYPDTIQAGTT